MSPDIDWKGVAVDEVIILLKISIVVAVGAGTWTFASGGSYPFEPAGYVIAGIMILYNLTFLYVAYFREDLHAYTQG